MGRGRVAGILLADRSIIWGHFDWKLGSMCGVGRVRVGVGWGGVWCGVVW